MSKTAKIIERRCGECGIGKVRPTKGAGRTARYKNAQLEIPADLEIPTCDNCGAEWLDPATGERFEAALEQVYRKELRALFERAITLVIDANLPMRRVESALGLSEGYLSKTKQGRSEPSAHLVCSLALIGRDPEVGLSTLERMWDRPRAATAAPAKRARGTASRPKPGRRVA